MREAVQCDTSLLIDAVYLLRMAHQLGSEVDALRFGGLSQLCRYGFSYYRIV